MGDVVPFAEWTGELMLHARLSWRDGAEAKASLNMAIKYAVLDPKPSDLAMSRLKFRWNWMEDRTDVPGNVRGWLVASGEIPIELGYSWFSPK